MLDIFLRAIPTPKITAMEFEINLLYNSNTSRLIGYNESRAKSLVKLNKVFTTAMFV